MRELPDSSLLQPARSEPGNDLNRRDFVRAGLGSGFAAAVLPVQAQTEIKTGATGLSVGEVSIAVGEHRMPAYRAAPPGIAAITEVPPACGAVHDRAVVGRTG